MEVGDVEEFDDAAVAVAVGEFAEARSIGADEVGVAVVMLAGEEHDVFAVGGPFGDEVEGGAGFDVLGVGAVGVGDVDLVVFVIGEAFAVGGCVDAVGEFGFAGGEVAFVFSVGVHVEGVGDGVDDGLEAELSAGGGGRRRGRCCSG